MGLNFYHPKQNQLNSSFQALLERVAPNYGGLGITSGYRSPKYNNGVGGAKGSRHQHGTAADIDLAGMDDAKRAALVNELLGGGARGFITYDKSPNMMHVDMGIPGVRPNAHFMHNKSHKNMSGAPSWFQDLSKQFQGSVYKNTKPEAKAFAPNHSEETNTVPPAMQQGGQMIQTMTQQKPNKSVQHMIAALMGGKKAEALPDPNYTANLAEQLMSNATDTPVAGNFDGIGRLAMMLSGGMNRGKYEDDLMRQKSEKSQGQANFVNSQGGAMSQALLANGMGDQAIKMVMANNDPNMLMKRDQIAYGREQDGIQNKRNVMADLLQQKKFDASQGQVELNNGFRNKQFDAGQTQQGLSNDLNQAKFDASQVPKAPVPLSTLGKINQDATNGFMTSGQQALAVGKANNIGKGVTVNNNLGENNYATKKLTDMDVKNYGAQVESAEKLLALAPEVNRIAQLSTQTATGGMGEMKLKLAQWLNIDYEGKKEAELIKAITSRLAPAMRPTGSGSSSDKDVAMFLTSLPQLLNSPGGSAIIAETITKIGQRRMEEANIKRGLIDVGQVQNYAGEVAKLPPLFEPDYFNTDPSTMSDDDLRAQIKALEGQ